MGLRKPEEYVEDLKKQRREIYAFGTRIDGDWTEHPIVKPVINANKLPFELSQRDEYYDLMTKDSILINERISRFVGLHRNPDDVLKRTLSNRELQLRHGSCHAARCSGTHGINALFATSYDTDQKYGTNYHQRFTKWIENVQRQDQAVNLSSCDVKGNRSQNPSKQKDPDMYVRIAEKKSDGIVIRGAKAHQSCAIAADWHLVVPYVSAGKGEEEYALSCAIPADTKGVVHIYESPAGMGVRLQEGADIDTGIPNYGIHGSTLIIFDDVFVPYEHVFLAGEREYSFQLVMHLGKLQRAAATMCKSAAIELMAGAAILMTKSNGLDWKHVSHIKDKIIHLANLAARCKGCSLGACAMSQGHPSGVFFSDDLLSNAAKLTEVEAISDATTALIDIAGGLVGTLPSEKDLRSPETNKYIEKYLKAGDEVDVADRMRIFRLCEYLSGGASTLRAASVHTGGSPEIQKLILGALANFDELESHAKNLACLAR